MVDNDPKTPTEVIREGIRVSRYEPGTQGTAVGTFLSGGSPLGAPSEVGETRFVDVSGKSFNTIYPNDFSYWELVHELVQQEPPGAGDPELMGLLAAVGIVHGKPFEPDDRMRKILEDAAVVGNATGRTVTFAARPEEGFAYYPGSEWSSALFVGGYQFLDPPPEITPDGPVPAAPSDGARKLNSRTNFFYMATGITPAMCMRLTGIGSQYIYAMRDSERLLRGARTTVTLPAEFPSRFEVLMRTPSDRSMLQTASRIPARGGARHRRGQPGRSTDSTSTHRPDGKASNWIQTVRKGGGHLRTQPPTALFDKSGDRASRAVG